MDLHSIDEVIQSTRRSEEYNHTLSSPDYGVKKTHTPYNTSINRTPNIHESHPPPSPRSYHPSISTSSSKSVSTEHTGRSRNATSGGFTDFFSEEVFQMVLRNPTTSHRFLKFCQRRSCGEAMEFLSQIDNYNRLLDDLTKTLSNINKSFIGPNADNEINISSQDSRAIQKSIRHSVNNVIPSLDNIFSDAEEHLESILLKDIYPRFVKHQITTSATLALGTERNSSGSYLGLGDCFCLTDPSKADNPIVFASDGFVDVTGYTRKEVIPRNCRFLQGPLTDRCSTKRLKTSIGSERETVELLLNYRKNGDPFWNLLYVSPLYDHNDKLAFFIGGQINCSTTIHSYPDILRILSLPEDEDDDSISHQRPSSFQSNGLHRVVSGTSPVKNNRSSFFKSWTGWGEGSESKNLRVLDEPGLEGHLTNKFRKAHMGLDAQVEAFYTAYSKYLVLRVCPQTNELLITFYSPSMLEFLIFPQLTHKSQNANPLSRSHGPSSLSLFHRDIFKVLNDQPLSANLGKTFKSTVRDAVRNGKAVSVEMGMMTGMEEAKKGRRPEHKRVEEKYISHWTVLKDDKGRGPWVVLTFAPKEK